MQKDKLFALIHHLLKPFLKQKYKNFASAIELATLSFNDTDNTVHNVIDVLQNENTWHQSLMLSPGLDFFKRKGEEKAREKAKILKDTLR